MHSFLSPVTTYAGQVEVGNGQMRFAHRWSPRNEQPWGVLTIVHGFGDHGGRFAGMATSLASIGVAVSALDLIGHGRSPGRRGIIDSYDQLLDEVERSVVCSQSVWPRIPQFLFGQSMGGNLVLNWLLRREVGEFDLTGTVVGSPMLKTPSMPREQIMNAGRWLARKLPNLRLPAPVQADKLSQDRRAQDAYLRDPWVHRTMSLRLAAGLIDSGLWAIEHAERLSVPTLVMHGSEDRLTCPHGSLEFASRSGGMATHRLWPGCRHDLHEEPQREWIFAFMIHWLKEQCISVARIPTSRATGLPMAA